MPRSEILVGLEGVVKCNVSMSQITDSYGCNEGRIGFWERVSDRFGGMLPLSCYRNCPYNLFICIHLRALRGCRIGFGAGMIGPISKEEARLPIHFFYSLHKDSRVYACGFPANLLFLQVKRRRTGRCADEFIFCSCGAFGCGATVIF